MRVLFVDDEPRILEAIERAFLCEDDWEILTAPGGKEGLLLLESETVDIVVSDMRMPGMDGAEFLHRVYELYPQYFRLVLSGQADQESSLLVMNVAHQFLNKPCSPETLRAALSRALIMRSLVDNEGLRTLVGRVDQLPVAPRAFQELSTLLEREDAGPREAAAIVGRDPALAAKVLQLVNSSFFTRGESISELLPAVTRLGLRVVRYVALQVGVFAEAQSRGLPLDVDVLQAQCLRASEIARRVVTASADREAAGAAALLADLGLLVMAMFEPDTWRTLTGGRANFTPSLEQEREAFGCTHPEISAYLLALWGLPDGVMRAVLTHHMPLPVPEDEIDLSSAVLIGQRIAGGLPLLPDWAALPALAPLVAELAAGTSSAPTPGSARRSGI